MTSLAVASPRPPVPTSPKLLEPAPEAVLEFAMRSLDDDQAEDVVVIALAGKSYMADFLVVASGRSTRHVGSMAENVRERLKASGVAGIEIEGLPHCDWVLVDAGDVIVHLFRPEVRTFYNLEKMWGVEPPVAVRLCLEEPPISADSGLSDEVL